MAGGSDFSAFIVVSIGTGINAVNAIQTGKDVVPVLVGGAVLGTACVALNETGYKIGTMLAILFLLSSFLTNGVRMIDTLNAVVSSS